jgi:hypothetical protein
MCQQFALGYYYVSPDDDEKMITFGEVSGDSLNTLVTQYIRGWIGRKRDYYLNLAKMDAQARVLTSEQWVDIMLSEGSKGLPPYETPIIRVEGNPLRDVALLPVDEMVKRQLNYIVLAEQNICLLRVAVLYDGDSLVRYVSRIIKEHLQRNWETLYLPQVQANQTKIWF